MSAATGSRRRCEAAPFVFASLLVGEGGIGGLWPLRYAWIRAVRLTMRLRRPQAQWRLAVIQTPFAASLIQRARASLPSHATAHCATGLVDGRSCHAYAIDAGPARTTANGYLRDHIVRAGSAIGAGVMVVRHDALVCRHLTDPRSRADAGLKLNRRSLLIHVNVCPAAKCVRCKCVRR